MSLKTILATLVLVGSSTAALARPYPTATVTVTPARATVSVRDHRDVDGQWFRQHQERNERELRPVQERVYWPGKTVNFVYETPSPVVYEAAPASAPCAFENGSQTILLGGAIGPRIQLASSGSTYVSKIAYTYSSGHTGYVPVNQYIDANNPIEIAVKPSGIYGVTVYGSGAPVSAAVL